MRVCYIQMLLRKSTPHMSFFRRVSVKSCLLRLITRMGNGALRNVMLSPEVFSSERPSRLTRKCLFLPSATSLISASSPITSGRTLRLCGATGVIMKLDALGATMGPPTLRNILSIRWEWLPVIHRLGMCSGMYCRDKRVW